MPRINCYSREALLLLSILFFISCTKFGKAGFMPQSGIAITFDDDFVDNWYEYLPMLDSAGVKATFYITRYHKFTRAQKEKLREIQSHGHEIAYHTTHHFNMLEYVYSLHRSGQDLLTNEIEEDLYLMRRDGFYPISFAYPYGARDTYLDSLLKPYFKSVRALNGTNDFANSLVPTENNYVLYGLDIDIGSHRSDECVLKVLESSKRNDACAVLVCHCINTGRRLSVTRNRLQSIFEFVKENNMTYYTVSEISH